MQSAAEFAPTGSKEKKNPPIILVCTSIPNPDAGLRDTFLGGKVKHAPCINHHTSNTFENLIISLLNGYVPSFRPL